MGPAENVDGMMGFMSKDSMAVGAMHAAGLGVGAGAAGFLESTSTMGGRGYNEMEMDYMNSIRRSDAYLSRDMAGDFDGMAISDGYLCEYYSQVSAQPQIMQIYIMSLYLDQIKMYCSTCFSEKPCTGRTGQG